MASLAFRKASICSRLSFSASCTWMVNPQHPIPFRLILYCIRLHLALVQFEVDNLPWFGFPPRQFLLNLLLEVLLRHLTGFVQPGCTIEVLPVSLRELG